MRIAVGTYTGSGVARTISGLGFTPGLILIKGVSQHPVFKIRQFSGDKTAYFNTNVAHLTNGITGFTSDGFTLGTDVTVNNNTTAYYWIAVAGDDTQNVFRTGRYQGNGVDDRNMNFIGVNFTPDLVSIKGDTTQSGCMRSLQVGDSSGTWDGTMTTNMIQSLIANGFQLGTSTKVNSNGVKYWFLALKNLAGVIKTGSYVGDGNDGHAITGIGFTPDVILTKDITGNSTAALKTSSMSGNNSFPVSNGGANTTSVKTLDADGFTLGTNSYANANGSTYVYLALKAGSFIAPVSRNSV